MLRCGSTDGMISNFFFGVTIKFSTWSRSVLVSWMYINLLINKTLPQTWSKPLQA